MAFDLTRKDLIDEEKEQYVPEPAQEDFLSKLETILDKVNSILEKVEAIRNKSIVSQALPQEELPTQPIITQPTPIMRKEIRQVDIREVFKNKDEAMKFIDGFVDLLPNSNITTQDIAAYLHNFFEKIPQMQLSQLKLVYKTFRPMLVKEITKLYGGEDGNKCKCPKR
jgi:hypothetical protein